MVDHGYTSYGGKQNTGIAELETDTLYMQYPCRRPDKQSGNEATGGPSVAEDVDVKSLINFARRPGKSGRKRRRV